jgi:hypothetical protein
MKSALRIAVAALAVLAALVYFFSSAEEEGGVPILDWLRDPDGSRDRHAAHLAGTDDPGLSDFGASAGPPTGPLPRWSGRVLRLDGSPVAGIALRAGSQELARTTTDERGRFTLPPGAQSERVQLDGDRWIVLGSGSVASTAAQDELQIVVAPRTALAGRVTDASGAPIEGAMVSAFMPLALAAADEVLVELAANYERRSLSDAEGRFALTEIPFLPLVRIDANKPGYERVRRPLPEDPSIDVEIVLEPAAGAQPR